MWGTICCALVAYGPASDFVQHWKFFMSTKRKIFPVPIKSDPNNIAHVYERLHLWEPYRALGIVVRPIRLYPGSTA